MNIDVIESTFKLIAPRADQLAGRFYDRLFMDFPAVKPLFANTDDAAQRQKLIASLVFIVENLRNPDKLTEYLENLGERYAAYGAEVGHYPAVGQTLLLTVAEFVGDAWTPEAANAWKEAVGAVAKHMLAGAARHSTGQTTNSNADN